MKNGVLIKKKTNPVELWVRIYENYGENNPENLKTKKFEPTLRNFRQIFEKIRERFF